MKYLSTFSGIGGFELGIQLAYESLCDADGSPVGGGKIYKTTDKRTRLQPTQREGITTTERPISECFANITNERPLCIGYSEIDKYASAIYQKHFPTHHNYGDITKIVVEDLPDFDLLVGGFPCQAFSIAGKRGGFEDTRGTMFFELARILRAKQPRLFVFENVKGLLSHDGGKSFATIIQTLDELGYDCQWQVLNSKNHGVPQNRERVFIIGHLRGKPAPEVFPFGQTVKSSNQPEASKKEVLAGTLTARMFANWSGNYIRETIDGFHAYRNDRKKSSIQGTHVTYPTGKSHALGTSHRPMTSTQNSIRQLTPTECERLQGFPDGWTEGVSDTQRYKCLGNAVTVNVIKNIFERILL